MEFTQEPKQEPWGSFAQFKDSEGNTFVLGALATRDWRPMHHDHDFAVNRNGTRDIFLNTPNQAAWFERYVTDWSGPWSSPRTPSWWEPSLLSTIITLVSYRRSLPISSTSITK